MPRYCPPVTGQWRPENGVILRIDPYSDPRAPLKDSLFRTHGIPVDEPIPHNVAALAEAGVNLAAYPDQAAPIWALARALLVAAQTTLEAAAAPAEDFNRRAA